MSGGRPSGPDAIGGLTGVSRAFNVGAPIKGRPTAREAPANRRKQMERRDFVRHGGIAGILAAGSAPAIAQTLPEVRWRMASSFPKALDTLYGAAEFIARRVGDITGGRFRITPSVFNDEADVHRLLEALAP